ncbi:MAG TPA: hypothetical protein DCZ34_00315 [Clostridiales bacterium]|nr:hypothetical protein [Clostridiales bacterium]
MHCQFSTCIKTFFQTKNCNSKMAIQIQKISLHNNNITNFQKKLTHKKAVCSILNTHSNLCLKLKKKV